MTIKEGVKKVFDRMPKTFYSIAFCQEVRKITGKFTMDGTILRRLRELRSKGKLDYKVINVGTGQYEKI